MIIDKQEIIISGRLIKIARIEGEWFKDVKDPESLIKKIRDDRIEIDIFTFWQRLPNSLPQYNYTMEWDNVAALSISTFEHWWTKQIDAKTRNVIRKAEKKGVVIKVAQFDDNFVKGIADIFNETPIRQDKPFWHYGKDIETIKKEMSDRLDQAEWIGAYYDDNLIGFIKLLYAGEYAMTVEILSMIKHRDKSPTNALLSKAVEICHNKNVPYLVYAKWPTGTLADFKRNNDFKKIDLPRYYIPLTIKGRIALKLNLHHNIREMFPEKVRLRLIDLRKKWYLSRNE